jgi:ferritin-like metal-binding protein YciE
MPQMTTPEELFLHELEDMYYAENALVKALPELAGEASDPELADAFEHHLEQTKSHVANLERVFEQLGKPASGEQCPGIDGIKKEHDTFMQENDPSEAVGDLFLTGAGARAEHYEIAAYTGLVAQAKALGETESAKLLKENLEQEKGALETVESISKRLLEAAAEKASVS